MEEDKNPFLEQYQALEEIRKNILTEDERIVLNLKLEGKTDVQIAAVLGVTTSAVNQKKRHLYKLIESLVWWKNNEERILTLISTNLSLDAFNIFRLITQRKRQNEIAVAMGMSLWRINKIFAATLEAFSKEPEFRAFFENLHLGYKVPWKHGPLAPPAAPQTGSEPPPEPAQPRSEPPSEPPQAGSEAPPEPPQTDTTIDTYPLSAVDNTGIHKMETITPVVVSETLSEPPAPVPEGKEAQ